MVCTGGPYTSANLSFTIIAVSADRGSLQPPCALTFSVEEATAYPAPSISSRSTLPVEVPWKKPASQPPPNVYTSLPFQPEGGFHGSGSGFAGSTSVAVW